MSNINLEGLTKEDQLIELVKSMNILELSEGVKKLEEIFGVSMAAMSSGSSNNEQAKAPIEEKTSFDVVLKAVGPTKTSVIRVVNKIVEGGLKEAKDVVESALPIKLKENLPKAEAEELQKQLQEAGAEVVLE